MKKKFTIKILFICLLTSVFFACSGPKEQQPSLIKEYFNKTHSYKIGNTIDKIVVVAEGNSCGSCESAFAETAIQHLQNENTIFLVTAVGRIIDIQPFLRLNNNCFFDWELDISEFPELESSRIIYLKNNEIDTVVVLDSKDLLNQLEYIKEYNN